MYNDVRVLYFGVLTTRFSLCVFILDNRGLNNHFTISMGIINIDNNISFWDRIHIHSRFIVCRRILPV